MTRPTDFREYERIPAHFKDFQKHEDQWARLSKQEWVVTEKVHGANFSFVYEGKKLRYAKRREFLEWTDDFFGYQKVASQMEERILGLFEQLRTDFPAKRHILYGELFGGSYPHENVPPAANVEAIQTGVYYAPDIAFYAFDIAVETDSLVKHYLDYDTALQYFTAFDFIHAKILASGKLSDVLDFNIRINSTIPAQLNLPALQSNLIEGVVIKTRQHLIYPDFTDRPIIKIKNAEFNEEKFHLARKWSYIPQIGSKSLELGFLLEDLRSFVTVNRLHSAVSKIGGLISEARLAAIESEFLNDVLFNFNDQNAHILEDLNDEDLLWIRARLSSEIKELIKTVNKT